MQPYNNSNIDSNFSLDNSNFNQQLLNSNKNNTYNKNESCEFLIYNNKGDAKIIRFPSHDTKDRNVLKGSNNVHVNSSDGMTLFTGLNELHVKHYNNDNSLLSSETFSLLTKSDEVSTNQRSRTRHLRQIESISCTSDASYALIICSDNTVLLYSICDIYKRGNPPISCNNSINNNKSFIGIITLLFQANDSYKIEVCISSICEDGNSFNSNSQSYLCDCNSSSNDSSIINNLNQSNNCNIHNKPNHVICVISWWQISNPGENAVLRKTRLINQDEIRKNNQNKNDFTYNVVPTGIAIPGVGLYNNIGNNKKIRGESPSCLSCWLCGDFYSIHWDRMACQDGMIDNDNSSIYSNDVDSSDDEKEIRQDIIVSKKERGNKIHKQNNNSINEISTTKNSLSTSNNSKVQKKLWTDEENESGKKNQSNSDIINIKQSETNFNLAPLSSASSVVLPPSSTEKQNKIIQSKLEEELKGLRSEISVVIRKADRRFEAEKVLRKAFHKEKSNLLNEIEKLKQDCVRSEEVCQNKLRDSDRLISLLSNCPLKEIMSILNNGSSNNCKNIQEMNQNYENDCPSIKAPFCVICQDYTATILCGPCGHICLCEGHAQRMIESGKLNTCPVCTKECKSTCKIHL
jgi:hypothetical protein